MAFDLFQSTRNFNEYCKWWSQNESDDYYDNEIVYKRVPDGCFYAKEISPETKNDNTVAGIVMFDKNSVTIYSPDDLQSLYKAFSVKNRGLVEYQGELWRIENVQKRKARIQNSEFASDENVSHYWYISLIK